MTTPRESMRTVSGKALTTLGLELPNLVVLDADTSHSTQTWMFGEQFSDRFINCGIAEANMVSVAAASILAKVTRDRRMVAMEDEYPGYGFAAHKGYGAPRHLQALRTLGGCPEHRCSFAPLAGQLALFTARESTDEHAHGG